MYNTFTYCTPTKVVFGPGTEEKTGALAREAGASKVLLVYGSERVIQTGLVAAVEASLKEAGIESWRIGGVVPNPRLSKVREGIELGKREGADFLLAVGGGSVMDTAKAIAYGLAEPELDVWDLYEHTRLPKACLPLGVVVTMAASGSEMSNSSVITNEENGEKRGCNTELCRPRFAVMNPDLTKTLPDYQTMAGCADIMMHTMERYFTNKGNLEITDAIAEALLRTVMEAATILHKDPQNEQARANILWAGSLSHNDLTGLGNGGNDFASHRLEHEMGGMFDVTHGAGLTAVWPSWARYVYKDCLHRFVRFALEVMRIVPLASDEETALAGITAMEEYFRSIGMPVNMKELGITPTEAQIEEMATGCELAVGGHLGAAKVLYRTDFVNIYQGAKGF